MSFSAQTCLTNTGTTQLGSTLYFYADVTNYQTSFGSDLTENLIGDNCPYTMENIPDGTTIVRIIDPSTNCCVDITLESNDLCNTYNLNFDVYDTQTVSQIVAGNLIGDNADVTDYIINWYGPGEGSTNLEFTSGFGTAFANIGWDNTHPLTGSSAPLIQAGVYTPFIDRVIINGVSFSPTGGSGSYVANLDCINPSQVTVEALKCDNGNNVGDYSHHYLFDNFSVGTPPQSLSASFLLSANTNYLAWRFKGFDIEDRLKLTFYGSSYGNNPITLEDIIVSGNLTQNNFNNSSFPKSADTYDFFAKVVCLTGLTITEGDYITVQITPNPTNNNTKWDFYFKCLESFDCTSCLDNFKNTPYKIVLSSITSNLVSCNRNQINFNVSGCTNNQLSSSDTYKYFNTGFNTLSTYVGSLSPQGFNTIFYFSKIICSEIRTSTPGASCEPPFTICSTSSNNTISYNKSIVNEQGLISIQFSSLSDLQTYYNSYQTTITSLGIFYDNTQLNFYRYFSLKLPVPQNPLEQCGDTTIFQTYDIHCTSLVTTGGTGPYTMTITMPTIEQGLFPPDCELNCNPAVLSMVNSINYDSLTTSNNINVTTNVGSKYQVPFYCNRRIVPNVDTYSSTTMSGYFFVTRYANETIPYSGVSNNIISSLSAQTCNFYGNSVNMFGSYYQFVYVYKIQAYDPNNINNFRIYGSPITNFQYSGATGSNFPYDTIYELALEYSNGTITYQNSNYCI